MLGQALGVPGRIGTHQEAALRKLYCASAETLRKANEDRRFDRDRAAEPLEDEMLAWWLEAGEALFVHLRDGGFERLRNHVLLRSTGKALAKAELTDGDRRLLAELLAGFGFFQDADERANTIITATALDTAEAAGTFALEQLGLGGVEFNLVNPLLRELLLGRSSAAVLATKTNIEAALETILRSFVERGDNLLDEDFLTDLKTTLGQDALWQAVRFSRTETGIAAERAQLEVFQRNGADGKRWNILGANTRATHQALEGVEKAVGGTFDVGGNAAQHPLDPTLPADELVNCNCWLSPVVGEGFEINGETAWTGE